MVNTACTKDCTVPPEGESCIDTPIGKNPKLAFYCRNQKFGSILEEGNHSQHFLKPRSALDFVLLSAVFTLFFQFLQFSIGKKTFSSITARVVQFPGYFLQKSIISICEISISLSFHWELNHPGRN